MATDPKFEVVDDKAKASSPYYGCHNKPRPVLGQTVPSTNGQTFPYRFSTDCRYDLAMKDNRCSGCKHAKDFTDWHKGQEK